MSSNPVAFTEAELKFVQDVCHELGFEGKVPALECLEGENDGIVCASGFTLQKTQVQKDSILGPRMVPWYMVSETVWTPASRWQPEDADYRDFASCATLREAVKAMVLRDYEYKIDNVLMGVEMETAFGPGE